MAQSSGRDSADDPTGEPDGTTGRAASTDALWSDVRISPIEIALPGGVGYTLRAYRPVDALSPQQMDTEATLGHDDFDAAAAAVARRRRRGGVDDEDVDDDELSDDTAYQLSGADLDEEDFDEVELEDEAELEDEEAGEEESEAVTAEDVPVFLGRRGKVFLFHSPQKLVEFVRSDAEHNLTQLDSWAEFVRRVSVADVEPLEEDRYELDLVVENLRGGADAWDASVILKAGELARDVGYATRLEPVITALSPGSPLDTLDDQLRAAEAGGVGAFFARRRLKRVAGQQAALGWRTIIGKISAVVDWRD